MWLILIVLSYPYQETVKRNLIWPVESKRITSGFGPRRHPVTRKRSHHDGIDIGIPTGTSVRATAGGTVKFAGWKSGGMGRAVIIDHGNELTTTYGHLSRTKIRKGKRVKRGQTIAYSGNTGRSTGPHLYFEVKKNGKPIDPISYLAGRITDIPEETKTGTETTVKKEERERLKIIPGCIVVLYLPEGSNLEKRGDYWKVIYPPGRDGEYRIEKEPYHGPGIGKIEIRKTLKTSFKLETGLFVYFCI